MADDHRGCCTGNAGHVVMLREPKTVISPAFCVLGKVARVAEGRGSAAPLDDRGEVEERKRGEHEPLGLVPSSPDASEHHPLTWASATHNARSSAHSGSPARRFARPMAPVSSLYVFELHVRESELPTSDHTAGCGNGRMRQSKRGVSPKSKPGCS